MLIADVRLGEIIYIYAPTASKPKYHLCIAPAGDGVLAKFLFISTHREELKYEEQFSVPCSELPACISFSETGFSAFSFDMIPRYPERHYQLHEGESRNFLNRSLALKLAEFCEVNVTSHAKAPKRWLVAALKSIATRPENSDEDDTTHEDEQAAKLKGP